MTVKTIQIAELMRQSQVEFGTSGARGLVTRMTDEVCYAYSLGFLQYLEQIGECLPGEVIAFAGDLRPSTERILKAVAAAARDQGYRVQHEGRLPSPAVALLGFQQAIPTIMVTGSHIPDDRNGIKFNRKHGELLKSDEAGMKAQVVRIPAGRFDPQGFFGSAPALEAESNAGAEGYLTRYLTGFPGGFLGGKRLGVYQHSAVGRDLLMQILAGLGAEVTALGRSEKFLAVDTEAIRPEDTAAAARWSSEQRFDSIVSTDGDSDRPLVSDESGKWLRGDIAGILTARFLGADAVVIPVSVNSAVEKCGFFPRVLRTRIGSPFVIEGMQQAGREGARLVVGFEGNGGFLLHSPIETPDLRLSPLPTRDAVLVHLAVLGLALREQKPISRLVGALPSRFTVSDRLKEFPTEKSKAKLAELYTGEPDRDQKALEAALGASFGKVAHLDVTDGLRITFASQEVVHLRPSGNAPEFRCYTEADSEPRAHELIQICLGIMSRWR